MADRWDPADLERLAALAGLVLSDAERDRLSRELPALAAAADRLPPPPQAPHAVPPPPAGPATCPLRDREPPAPSIDAWPPGVAPDGDGWLPVPPVREEEDPGVG